MIDEGRFELFDEWMQQQDSLIDDSKIDPFSNDIPFDELAQTCDGQQAVPGEMPVRELGSNSDSAVPESPNNDHAFGSRSSLCAEALSILEGFSDRQIFRAPGVTGFPSAGALDLYSGRAGIARQLVKVGCPWVLCFDWARSADDNLLNSELQSKIFRLIELKVFRLVGSALI